MWSSFLLLSALLSTPCVSVFVLLQPFLSFRECLSGPWDAIGALRLIGLLSGGSVWSHSAGLPLRGASCFSPGQLPQRHPGTALVVCLGFSICVLDLYRKSSIFENTNKIYLFKGKLFLLLKYSSFVG